MPNGSAETGFSTDRHSEPSDLGRPNGLAPPCSLHLRLGGSFAEHVVPAQPRFPSIIDLFHCKVRCRLKKWAKEGYFAEWLSDERCDQPPSIGSTLLCNYALESVLCKLLVEDHVPLDCR